MIWYFVSLFILVLGIYVGYWCIKLHNRYTINFFLGLPGVGKSTLICKLSQEHLRKGWIAYSTEDTPGCYKFDAKEDFGKFHFSQNAAIFLDEVGLIWDSRDFKNFDKAVRNYIKKHRHYKIRIFMFSQDFDVDKKIRQCTPNLYLVIKYFGVLTICKKIKTKMTVVQPDGDHEGRIATSLVISPFLTAPFGGRIYCWIPKWYKYFNSFENEPLPFKPFPLVEYPPGVKVYSQGKLHVDPYKNDDPG